MSAHLGVTSPGSEAAFFATLISGTAFGASLAACGIYNPGLIIFQLQLKDFTMLRIFLTASVTGGAAIAFFKAIGYFSPQPRSPASKGWFGEYDGNIIGGLMQGAGMALTGACPGTVIVQAATGVSSSWPTIGGCLLGGLVYKLVGKQLVRPSSSMKTASPNSVATPKASKTLADVLSIPHWLASLLFLLGGAAIVYSLPSSKSRTGLLDPIRGGLFFGAAQFISILLRRKTVGVSTCYEDAWSMVHFSSPPGRNYRMDIVLNDSVTFATGIALGALVLSPATRTVVSAASKNVEAVSLARSVAGGAVLLFGARLAGGCTSGHGLSGTPTLGIASFLTTACMFLGGIPVALLLA